MNLFLKTIGFLFIYCVTILFTIPIVLFSMSIVMLATTKPIPLNILLAFFYCNCLIASIACFPLFHRYIFKNAFPMIPKLLALIFNSNKNNQYLAYISFNERAYRFKTPPMLFPNSFKYEFLAKIYGKVISNIFHGASLTTNVEIYSTIQKEGLILKSFATTPKY